MNAFAKVDKETFLQFAAEHAEQRYEYVGGRIVQQMTGGTREHGAIARRIARQLEDQIDGTDWWVLPDRGVDTPHTIRYPDVVVEPADEPTGSLSTNRPAVIIEVLSPSTASADLDEKPAEYFAFDTLDAYIIASQTEAAMLVYERGRDGRFPAQPREVTGIDARLSVVGRSFAITLSFTEIYAGIL
jgi:Uma2 family endonuclease